MQRWNWFTHSERLVVVASATAVVVVVTVAGLQPARFNLARADSTRLDWHAKCVAS